MVEVMLDGDVQEFFHISREPASSLLWMQGGVDCYNDCPNDDYRLCSAHFDGETDHEVIWQIAYEIISLFNGASVLLEGVEYHKVSIFRIIYNNEVIPWYQHREIMGLLNNPVTNARRREQLRRDIKRLSSRLRLVALAAENEDVLWILKYFNMHGDWSVYYKTLETVEALATRSNLTLEIDKVKRTAFTNSANNFSLVGLDARHGFKENAKKNRTSTLSIDEAFRFVQSVTMDYITQTHLK